MQNPTKLFDLCLSMERHFLHEETLSQKGDTKLQSPDWSSVPNWLFLQRTFNISSKTRKIYNVNLSIQRQRELEILEKIIGLSHFHGRHRKRIYWSSMCL